jgi:hypothetical protein
MYIHQPKLPFIKQAASCTRMHHLPRKASMINQELALLADNLKPSRKQMQGLSFTCR